MVICYRSSCCQQLKILNVPRVGGHRTPVVKNITTKENILILKAALKQRRTRCKYESH